MTASCPFRLHDTNGAYRMGCRCPGAREAHRLYRKRRREGRAQQLVVPSIGTIRRLRALAAIGWSLEALAAELGYKHHATVGNLMSGRHKSTCVSVARRVADAFERLSMTPGPSKRARLRAARMGWAPPLAWNDDAIDDPQGRPAGAATASGFDEVAVERAVRGELPEDVKLRQVDAHEAIRQMRALGLSTREIARRANVSDRTVHRQGHETTTAAA